MKAFRYIIKNGEEIFPIIAIAPNGTVAREALTSQFPGASITYESVTEKIIQANG